MIRVGVVASLLIVLVGITIASVSCFMSGDAFYELTVVNRSSKPVEVFVDGHRRGPRDQVVEACSQHAFDLASYNPRRALKIEVRDLQGNTVLATEQVPRRQGGPYDLDRVLVMVPATTDNACPEPSSTARPSDS